MGEATPSPSCLHLKPVINNLPQQKSLNIQVTDSPFSSIFREPCWALFETWTTVCEVLVFSLKMILWSEMCYWFGGTSYESLEWLQTCNDGYPHSTATVCHWHWQTLHWTARVELAMGIMLQVVKGIQNVSSVTFHLCVVTTESTVYLGEWYENSSPSPEAFLRATNYCIV